MGACEQETMDLILAHERQLQAEEARQRDPRLRGRYEVDSHAAGAAPPQERACWDGIISGTPAFHLR